MKKITLCIILLVCICPVIFGQFTTIPVALSTFAPDQFIKVSDGGFIGFKRTRLEKSHFNSNAVRFSISVIKYDKDMNFVKEQLVPGSENGFAYYYSSLKESGNKVVLICLETLKDSKKAKHSNVVAFEIDPATLQMGNSKVIADQNNINQNIDGYWIPGYKLLFETSQDKKHHALFIYNNDNDFYISGLNENLEPAWKYNGSLPEFKMKAEYFRSLHCDNTGNVYLLSSSEKDGNLVGSFTNGRVTYKKIMAGAENINDAAFFHDAATGSTGLAGTCMNNSENVTGVFKAILNTKTLDLEQLQITTIPADLMELLAERDYAKLKSKNPGFIPSFFRSCLVGKDNPYLILECKDRNRVDGSVRFAVDIMIINFKPTVPVFSYIRRYVVTGTPDMYQNGIAYTANEGTQYFPFECNNRLAIVYFDNAENINKTIKDKPTTLKFDKNAMLVSAFISADGSIQKKEVVINGALGVWQNVNKFLYKECETK